MSERSQKLSQKRMEAPLQRLFMLRYSRQRCPSAISFAASEYLELPAARRENCASCSAVQACPNERITYHLETI